MGVDSVDVTGAAVTKPTRRNGFCGSEDLHREPLHPVIRFHGMDFTGVYKPVVTLVLVLGINYPYSTSPDFVTC